MFDPNAFQIGQRINSGSQRIWQEFAKVFWNYSSALHGLSINSEKFYFLPTWVHEPCLWEKGPDPKS